MRSNRQGRFAAVAAAALGLVLAGGGFEPAAAQTAAVPGDVFVSLVSGQVQWRDSTGALRRVLIGTSAGQASSLAFDAGRNLYVPHWYAQVASQVLGPVPGNTIERFDANGLLIQGYFGSGYDCNPSSVTFDGGGNVYVGQADCSGDILKFDPDGRPLDAHDVPTTLRGTDHVDLADDGCTMFYTSRDRNVYRYDVCARAALPNFNVEPLPGSNAYHVAVLPDGGVLVADAEVIVRLDADGRLVRTYTMPDQTWHLYGGVDYVGDGTFWATNGWNPSVMRFDLETGAVVGGFTTGTDEFTVAGVAVVR